MEVHAHELVLVLDHLAVDDDGVYIAALRLEDDLAAVVEQGEKRTQVRRRS